MLTAVTYIICVYIVYCVENVLTALTIYSIECIRNTYSLYIIFEAAVYRVVEKPLVLAFQNFLQIENRLNI